MSKVTNRLRKYKFKLLAYYLIASAVICLPSLCLAANSAVILQYHRFGESDMPSTNVSLDQFDEHLNHLISDGYTVLPVPHIIAALRSGTSLPDKAVGITIDDAAVSVFEEAWPRLNAAEFPFTVFVSTQAVDGNYARTMSWDQIRTLVDAGVTIGNHSSSHGRLWLKDISSANEDIEEAQNRFERELGFKPQIFAYPFGEYNLELRDLLEELNFEAAFGQNSGVASAQGDFLTLPRFSLNEHYGSLERFKLIINTLPMPVRDITPADPILVRNPPNIGFTIDETIENIENVACYASNQGSVLVELLGVSRVELRMSRKLNTGRNRVNCTLPGPDNRWRWLGLQYIVP